MDVQYSEYCANSKFIEHNYGDRVKICSNPLLLSLLAKFSNESIHQPLLNHYLEQAYSILFTEMMNEFFPLTERKIETRMKEFTDKGVFHGNLHDPKQRSVVVSLARAGIYPSHLIFEKLNYLFHCDGLREDHFYCNRKTNEDGEVIGVDVSGSKIGGGVDDAIVILPDPMGATGGSLCEVIGHYKESVPGVAKKYIGVHLMVTPEFIRRVQEDHPDAYILAGRLDRGLSTDKALKCRPGEIRDEEKGLTEKQYIVPGAGGVGELLNNSFV